MRPRLGSRPARAQPSRYSAASWAGRSTPVEMVGTTIGQPSSTARATEAERAGREPQRRMRPLHRARVDRDGAERWADGAGPRHALLGPEAEQQLDGLGEDGLGVVPVLAELQVVVVDTRHGRRSARPGRPTGRRRWRSPRRCGPGRGAASRLTAVDSRSDVVRSATAASTGVGDERAYSLKWCSPTWKVSKPSCSATTPSSTNCRNRSASVMRTPVRGSGIQSPSVTRPSCIHGSLVGEGVVHPDLSVRNDKPMVSARRLTPAAREG